MALLKPTDLEVRKCKLLLSRSDSDSDKMTTEALAKVLGTFKTRSFAVVKQEFPDVVFTIDSGNSNPDRPNTATFTGLRRATAKERWSRAKVAIICATDVELQLGALPCLQQVEEVELDDVDKKVIYESYVGLAKNDTGVAIAVFMLAEMGPTHAMLATDAIVSKLRELSLVAKLGHSAASMDMGVVVILDKEDIKGEQVVVIEKSNNEKKGPVAGLPSLAVTRFSHKFRDASVKLHRGAQTSGDKLAEKPEDTLTNYDMEFASIVEALEARNLIGQLEVTAVHVVTANFEQKQFRQVDPNECFEKLVKFFTAFLNQYEG